ncbi:S9 family peptidase [Mucilaginibacter myungsuensis]|uniref:DPP IV N-terminal domain-containing protein n=1 Tax=Mucilaginibacter myungsuensis TaxID=649104 RepID=A0A929L178_9SPHI|nr:S9 family peptidase [Mucilaginibacter myungsuensis]MBE9662624.1 DPP IV N-terminal domain-containing protein [Mucilaginibacter myungsuensis]MDN3598044.1 DPP IV N-terminal domain-containing protein [Mucilaginibacter myungsuensis]
MNKFLLSALPFALALTAQAQAPAAYTAKDYERAETQLTSALSPLVTRGGIRPNWMPDDRFWYKASPAEGGQFMVYNPAKGSKALAFDHAKLAAALSATAGKSYTATTLPFTTISFAADKKSVIFTADGKQYKFDGSAVTPDSTPIESAAGAFGGRGRRGGFGAGSTSPDKKKVVFIKDYNLWVRDVATNKETQLTTDGVKDNGYGTDNAGWAQGPGPILVWSPDSKKIATFQQDERQVNDFYMVNTSVGAPKLYQWKYPFPGDKVIPMLSRVIINVDEPKVIRLKCDADPHRSTLSDDIKGGEGWADVYWSDDATKLVFASTNRDHKEEKVRMADAATGDVREIFQETVKTQFESGWGDVNWRYLSKSNEILWFSERDNWGHLYLYDATTGKLKNQIDKGEWVNSNVVKVDEKARVIYLTAMGLQKENPYFAQLCKVNFDGKGFTVLTPGAGTHSTSFSPSGNYIIDTYSKPDVAPVTVLRDMKGKQLLELEKTDISKLTATGWKPVIPFSTKAADGKTDVYGLMWVPRNLDPNKKYPVIDYIYPGPQGGSVGSWSFSIAKGDCNALAELGFVVVAIEGTSNPYRSKSFHDMSYGNMADNTLGDQVAGIKELATRYPYIDVNKVGIWGHSGGGFATAGAMFRFPDFFKVGIAESGNHENLNYEDNWGERYNGLVTNSDYAAQANQSIAKNLKGKLMLVHGLLDNNVPMQNTMLVVEALERANKSFDLVVFPNSAHGFGEHSAYMMRRRWDYFVKHLKGIEPPLDYKMTGGRPAQPTAAQ